LSRLADDFERHSNETLADPERFLGNPVNAYLLIKRFTADWERLVNTQIRAASAEGSVILIIIIIIINFIIFIIIIISSFIIQVVTRNFNKLVYNRSIQQ